MPRNFHEQFDNLQSPKIVLTQAKSNKSSKQRNGVLKKTKANQKPNKSSLVIQLQELLKVLPDVSNIQNQQKNNQFKDYVMQQLQALQKKAQLNGYKDIQKLCMLAIGKRILNIQLKKKRQQFQKKQKKKSQIQQFFRENRIKKFNYQALVRQKLSQQTLIVRPYASGKGFIGSGLDYRNYQDSLHQCDYINVVRQVNTIFFDIFSGKKKDSKSKLNDLLFKIMWIPIVIFLVLIISLPFKSFQYEQAILTILLAIIIVALGYVSISTFLNVPNNNNQIQQSIQDTKEYFDRLNKENLQEGKQFEWKCPQNFMYLEVKFFHLLK